MNCIVRLFPPKTKPKGRIGRKTKPVGFPEIRCDSLARQKKGLSEPKD